MKILLLGKNGQLGWELERTLAPLGDVTAPGRADADLSRPDDLRELVRAVRPQIIVNAAAYTNVDRAESERDIAMTVNGFAPGVLAAEALDANALLIHYSTDYVFDGSGGSSRSTPAGGQAHAYTESDTPNPLSIYGQSKLAGERAIQEAGGDHLILRTSWLYSLRGESFVGKVLAWGRNQQSLRIVQDQVGSPTWARMLAEITAQLIGRGVKYCTERKGLYHLAGAGSASRFEWAQKILELDPHRAEHVYRELLPALSRNFPTPAQRPLVSALDCSKFTTTFGLALPAWDQSLKMAMSV